jgi:hypothetical protein
MAKKLEAVAKKRGAEDVRQCIKSVSNHVYRVASSSGSDGELKQAKWRSVIGHIRNKHDGYSEKFPACLHAPITDAVD